MIKFISSKLKVILVPLIFFSIYILIPQGVVTNLVVCMGDDGHFDVEIAYYGTCCSDSKTSLEETRNSYTLRGKYLMESQYSQCVDIPVLNANAVQQIVPGQNRKEIMRTLQDEAPIFQETQYKGLAVNNAHIKPSLEGNSTLDSLRSIILII